MTVGEPPTVLTPEEPTADAWVIEGLVPLDDITLLFADGGSMKSYFALALALAGLRNEPLATSARWCVRRMQSVLYLDWETDRATHARRLWRLLKGLECESPRNLHYLNLKGQPLHLSLPTVVAAVASTGADFLIVDSLGYACGDEPEAALTNLRTLSALSTLPGTKLVITHVNSTTATSPNGPGRPYGSVYVRNGPRSAIEARSEPDEHGALVTYYQRKNNEGPEAKPTAIRFTFSPNGALTMHSAEPDLQHAGIAERILSLLDSKGKTVADISEELDANEHTVKSALHRLEKRCKVDQLETGTGGRGKKSLWVRVDTKRRSEPF